MMKICDKCGAELAEDDFLCPICGAIWGDPIYRPSVTTEEPAIPEEPPVTEEPQEEVQPPTKGRKFRFKLILIVFVLLSLVAQLVWMSADLDLGVGQGSNPTTQQATTGMAIYTIRFKDQYGEPIAGVECKLLNYYASAPGTETIKITDENGECVFAFEREYETTYYFQVVSAPIGSIMSGNMIYSLDNSTKEIILRRLTGLETMPSVVFQAVTTDEEHLYEPISYEVYYPTGYYAQVKVKMPPEGMQYLVLVDGVVIKNKPVDSCEYLLYTFSVMQEETQLCIKLYPEDLQAEMVNLLKAYYCQYPDADEVEITHVYGHFGIHTETNWVVMLKTTKFVPNLESINGTLFVYPQECAIFFYHSRNQQIFTLGKAWEERRLTSDDIAYIYNKHIEAFDDLYISNDIMPI